MTTAEFIEALVREGVVDDDLARQLRAKAADGERVTPQAILKFLVKTYVITDWKSEELTAMLLAPPRAPAGQEDEILDLAPMEDDEEAEKADRRVRSGQPAADPFEPAAPSPKASSGKMPPPPKGDAATPSLDALSAEDVSAASGRAASGMYRLGGNQGKGKGKGKSKSTKRSSKQWDSPLILIGGGVVGLLAVSGIVLYFLLFRENAGKVMADADRLFDSGAYASAIGRYDDFLASYASHPDASRARVQREMTRLWQSVEGNADPSKSLALAKEVIAEVENEPAFASDVEGEPGLSQAKQDLGVLLVRIGNALVLDAERSNDGKQIETLVANIAEVLQLSDNTKYVPEKFRNAPALNQIKEQLALIRARQTRDTRLAAALASMDAAIAGGDSAAAYAARLDLLADFPALAADESLAEKVRAVSTAEQARVKFLPSDQAAETAWPDRGIVAELALAERRGESAAGAADPYVVRVDGSVFGLSSADGSLLWRRFAGYGETSQPMIVDGGGAIVANLAHGELWRLEAATGKLVWRLALGDVVTGVVAAGSSVLATAESGKLYVVNSTSGALQGHVQFSQPIRTAPVVNDRGDRVYVVAEHSIVYTLNATDWSCLGVFYTGQAAGAVAVPPVAILNKLVIADNTGSDACHVRILGVDANGAVGSDLAGDRLTGIVATPLATAARRVVAATTRGQVGVYEISGSTDGAPFTVVARRDAKDPQPLARFALLHDGKLWLAGRELAKFTLLPTENQLAIESLPQNYSGDAFDGPLAARGRLVLHMRRPQGRAGAIVAATDPATNRSAWELELAVPPAGAPAANDAPLRLTAVAASGAAYLLDGAAMSRGRLDAALRSQPLVAGEPPLTSSVDLGGGRLAAAAAGNGRLLLVRPEESRQVTQWVDLPAPLAGSLAAWQGGVVFPTAAGQVFFVDATNGSVVGAPFQPELRPGREFKWLRAATLGEGDQAQLFISDGIESLYRVERVAGATPHLAAAKRVDVSAAPLATPLAVVGNRVIAGTGDGRLAAFDVQELTPAELVELGGRAIWGPYADGEGALLATDAAELIRIGPDGAIAWRRDLGHGELAGQPLVEDGAALLLHTAGGLSQINLADGAETGFVDIGQPAVAGPVRLGPRIVVTAPDGTLVVVNRP